MVLKKYRLYCETCGILYCWAESAPSECPNDSQHDINPNSISIFEEAEETKTLLWDQKSTGTNGGTFTQGSWVVRELNQISGNTSRISLSNNQITLQPGIYSWYIRAPAFRCNNHKARLYDVTHDTTIQLGNNAFAGKNFYSSCNTSEILCRTPVSSETIYEIQQRCNKTEDDVGLGLADGEGDYEIYTQVQIDIVV